MRQTGAIMLFVRKDPSYALAARLVTLRCARLGDAAQTGKYAALHSQRPGQLTLVLTTPQERAQPAGGGFHVRRCPYG